MSRPRRSFVLCARVPQCRQIDSVEESLTSAKQDRRDGDVHFVDEALAKILLDDVDPATKSDILAFGSLTRALKSDDSAVCHEVKGRSTLHDKRWARVVRQHEYCDVIHRIFAPP